MSEKERLQLENELLMTCSKAQAINKYIDELEESSKLSELWCKSQQENQQLQNNWNELKKWLEEETKENDTTIKKCDQVILKMGNENRKDTHQHKLIDVCSRENLVFNRMLSKMQELEGKNE